MNPRHLALLSCLMTTPLLSADELAASAQPPGGLRPAQVPQFILVGFDDNPQVEPMAWFIDHVQDLRNPAGAGQAATFDGGPVRAIFFSNGKYWNDRDLITVHHRALNKGHEIANHTQNHLQGGGFTVAQWRREMADCEATFAETGIPATGVVGFRTPFLAYNAATFAALAAEAQVYDSSIEEGHQAGQDGTNFFWPYTLDQGSPGNAAEFAEGSPRRVGRHPGLWEIPLHVFMIPADADCARLGVAPGLQARMGANLKQAYGSASDEPAAKITGLDWNVLEAAKCNGPELLAILKHTLDLRLAGNRAPFMVGAHTALYPANKPDRRKAMEEFIAYALTKPEVRFVTGQQLLAWLRKPQPLGTAGN
ncbi:MAG TPA: polysaccharide deacetylase family protein [Lacunisphaera sp.]|nr:polysaccharide deacetylase family protein [Lacunisphaera sp.]